MYARNDKNNRKDDQETNDSISFNYVTIRYYQPFTFTLNCFIFKFENKSLASLISVSCKITKVNKKMVRLNTCSRLKECVINSKSIHTPSFIIYLTRLEYEFILIRIFVV